MNIKKIQENLQLIEPENDLKVPIKFHVADDLMPDQKTIDQLLEVGSQPNIFHHISALSDVHHKKGRRNPSGTVVAVEDHFLPQLVDTAPNCGMRLIKTPFSKEDLPTEKIDQLFRALVATVPTKAYLGSRLPFQTIVDISRKGSMALLEYFDKDPEEIESTMNGGNMFENEIPTEKELFSAVPELFFRAGSFRLGILGAAGNHFLDLMKVDEILDDSTAQKWGMKKDQYLFMIHTGSGLFGQYASYFYTPKVKEHTSQRLMLKLGQSLFREKNTPWFAKLKKDLQEFKTKEELYQIPSNSEIGRNYFLAHRAAANHGYANRAMIQINLEKTMEKILGKKFALPLIYDMTHISVTEESHFGKNVFVHRNNTTRAFGPSKMKKAKIYSQTGEPVFLPSSMSTPAYLGAALDGNEATFCSSPHGTGRSKTATSNVPQNKEELFQKMEERKVRLYNAASKGVIQQDASSYKDVEKALQGIKENQIMKPVAKMSPVAVLMY